MLDITSIVAAIIVALLSVLATWVTTTVIPWLKARTTAEQRKLAMTFAKTFVSAAEQFMNSSAGTDKYQYVKTRLETTLAENKIKLDVDTIKAIIEEAVLELTVRQDWGLAETPVLSSPENESEESGNDESHG